MKTLLLLFVLVLTFTTYGQITCTELIIPNELGLEIDSNFNRIYYNDFAKIGYDTTAYFRLTTIDSLLRYSIYHYTTTTGGNATIAGFRVYLALDDSKTFRFIFTGLKQTLDDSREYYYLDNATRKSVPLDSTIAKKWVKHFQDSIAPIINRELHAINTRSHGYHLKLQKNDLPAL